VGLGSPPRLTAATGSLARTNDRPAVGVPTVVPAPEVPAVSDQPNPEQPRPQQQVQVIVPDDLKHGEYANFLVVSHSPHEFTLDFCQLLPSGEQGKVNAEVVSRVRIAPTMVARVLNALNTNMSNYEDRFGSVKALG
jgi:hypothetical protein